MKWIFLLFPPFLHSTLILYSRPTEPSLVCEAKGKEEGRKAMRCEFGISPAYQRKQSKGEGEQVST